MSTTNGESINLAGDLPNSAIDLAERKPDVRQAFATTSAGSGGDITSALSDADDNNQLLELGAGTYTISGSVSLGGSLTGLVGAGSDSTTIEISGTHEYLFGSPNCSIAVIEGVTFDMRGGGECAFGTFEVSDEGWFEDIVVRGQRDKIGNGTGRFSWMFEAVNSSATNFIHRVHQPDGDAHYSGENTVGHAIPFSADPDHHGLNVWKECHVQGFTDNGYYTGNSPSRNVFWNCTARDNRAGNFRVDTTDIIVGGSATLTSNAPGQATGQGIAVDYPSDVIVIGCQFVGDSYSDLVSTRQEGEGLTFDRCVVHGTDSSGGDLARFDGSAARVDIQGGWWLDEGGGGIDIGGAEVTADSNWAYRGDINGTITINGQSISSDSGLPDPQPFPSFHFDGVESGGGTDYGGGTGGTGGTGGDSGGDSGGSTGGPQFIDGSSSPGSRWGLTQPRSATLENVPEGPVSVTVEPQWFNTGGGGTWTGGGSGGDSGGDTSGGGSSTPGVSGGQVSLNYNYAHEVAASEGPAAIQAALESAAVGEGVTVTGNGEYEWAETVEVPNGRGLDISLDVTFVIPSDHNLSSYQSSGIIAAVTNADRSGAQDVTIKGGEFDMHNVPDIAPYAGLWLHNATNSQIRDTVMSGSGWAVHGNRDYRGFNLTLTQCTDCGIYDSEGHDGAYDDIGIRGSNQNCEVIGCGGSGGDSGTIQAAAWGGWDIGGGSGDGILIQDCWGPRIYAHGTSNVEFVNCDPSQRIQTLGVGESAVIRDTDATEGAAFIYSGGSDQPFTRIENMGFVTGDRRYDEAIIVGANGDHTFDRIEVANCTSETPTFLSFWSYDSSPTVNEVEVTDVVASGTTIAERDSGGPNVGTLAFRGCDFSGFSTGITGSYDTVIVENCTFEGMTEAEAINVDATVQATGNTFG